MKVKDLSNKSEKLCRTVFQRRDGNLKILQVPVKSKKKLEAHPMFPIQHDRDPEQDNENDDQE